MSELVLCAARVPVCSRLSAVYSRLPACFHAVSGSPLPWVPPPLRHLISTVAHSLAMSTCRQTRGCVKQAACCYSVTFSGTLNVSR